MSIQLAVINLVDTKRRERYNTRMCKGRVLCVLVIVVSMCLVPSGQCMTALLGLPDCCPPNSVQPLPSANRCCQVNSGEGAPGAAAISQNAPCNTFPPPCCLQKSTHTLTDTKSTSEPDESPVESLAHCADKTTLITCQVVTLIKVAKFGPYLGGPPLYLRLQVILI